MEWMKKALSPYHRIELLNMLSFLTFGITLLWPGNTFAVSPSYAALQAVFRDEIVLGAIFAGWGIVVGRMLSGTLRQRKVALFVSAVIWSCLTGAFLVSAVTTTTIYGVLAVMSLVEYLRLRITPDG